MNITTITTDELKGFPGVAEQFAWPGAVINISGSAFGKQGKSYAGLIFGSSVTPLKILSWTDNSVKAEIPANVATHRYSVGLFTPKTLSLPGRPTPGKPVQAGGDAIMIKQLNSNTLSLFVALGAPKAGMPVSQLCYYAQVHGFAARYSCEPEWITYMTTTALKAYTPPFVKFMGRNKKFWDVLYTYSQDPSGLAKPFESEDKHMELIKQLLELGFPGDIYNINIKFGSGFDNKQDVSIHGFFKIDGGTTSITDQQIFVARDSTLLHEFGHIATVTHHYQASPPVFADKNGVQEKCVMSLNSQAYCRGCCMAMGTDPQKSLANRPALISILTELTSHFPAPVFDKAIDPALQAVAGCTPPEQ